MICTKRRPRSKIGFMKKPPFAVVEGEHRVDLGCIQLAFAPDGKSIAGFLTEMGDHRGVARWDAGSGKLIDVQKKESKGHADAIAQSNDRSHVAVKLGKKVEILDGASLKKIATLDIPASSLGWSADGKFLASAVSNDVKCWDAATWREIGSVTLKDTEDHETVGFAGFSADAEEILIGRGSCITSWNVRKGKTQDRLKFSERHGWFWQHGLSPDRSVLLSLSDRGSLLQTDTRIWKSKPFKTVKSEYGHNWHFSPDGKLAATRTGQGTLFIWDVVEAKPWLKWSKPHFGNLRGIVFSPEGQRIACLLDFRLFILDFRHGAETRPATKPVVAAGMVQCVHMVGPDNRMDQNNYNEPLNPLPVKCSFCKMPDLDFVAQPYLVSRGIASPADMAPAEAGNFLVRESARRVLETVAPGQCQFYPTANKKTGEATPWFLAVPQRMEATANPPANVKRCPQCNEPWSFHQFSESIDYHALQSPLAKHEVFKARNWGSAKKEFTSWQAPRPEIFGRDLYFSLRLETLFKKLRMRGLVRDYACKETPSPEDLAWVTEMEHAVKEGGRPKAPKSADATEWFKDYLKNNAKKNPVVHDFDAVEKRQKLKLPESYRKFIAQVGTKTFKDVDGEEGFAVHILPPKKLDFEEFRKLPAEKGDEDRIEGVVFATTDHGDLFCFDVGRKNRDYPVFKYDHEIDTFEPYAANFAEAIKRFAGE